MDAMVVGLASRWSCLNDILDMDYLTLKYWHGVHIVLRNAEKAT
jgi:hypothetical protein